MCPTFFCPIPPTLACISIWMKLMEDVSTPLGCTSELTLKVEIIGNFLSLAVKTSHRQNICAQFVWVLRKSVILMLTLLSWSFESDIMDDLAPTLMTSFIWTKNSTIIQIPHSQRTDERQIRADKGTNNLCLHQSLSTKPLLSPRKR